MFERRKIWANGLPNGARSPKSGHRMAASGIQFSWRSYGGTISLNLGLIREMSVHMGNPGSNPIRSRSRMERP